MVLARAHTHIHTFVGGVCVCVFLLVYVKKELMLRSSSSSDASSLSCSFSQSFRCSDIPCHFMNNNMYFFSLFFIFIDMFVSILMLCGGCPLRCCARRDFHFIFVCLFFHLFLAGCFFFFVPFQFSLLLSLFHLMFSSRSFQIHL